MLHAAAFVICLVGLIILTVMGEPGALKQLVFFLICIVVAMVVAVGTIALLVG